MAIKIQRAKKPSKKSKLAKVLEDLEKKRDDNFNQYLANKITLDKFLEKERMLALKVKNMQFKIDQLKYNLPENGYAPYMDSQKLNINFE